MVRHQLRRDGVGVHAAGWKLNTGQAGKGCATAQLLRS